MKKKWLWIVPGILAVAVIVFLTMLWFANKKSLSMTETVSFEAQYIRTNGYHEWGVCGTGLESETIEIGGYEASQGNYNGGIWEFICFQKEPGWCVIKNDAAYAWLGKHIDEAMEIIDTVRVK